MQMSAVDHPCHKVHARQSTEHCHTSETGKVAPFCFSDCRGKQLCMLHVEKTEVACASETTRAGWSLLATQGVMRRRYAPTRYVGYMHDHKRLEDALMHTNTGSRNPGRLILVCSGAFEHSLTRKRDRVLLLRLMRLAIGAQASCFERDLGRCGTSLLKPVAHPCSAEQHY